MPIATTTAIFQNNVLIPKEKPSFGVPDEVLVTYVKYQDDAEDPDEAFFRSIEPEYRRIRREVFKERYPQLYKKYYGDSPSAA